MKLFGFLIVFFSGFLNLRCQNNLDFNYNNAADLYASGQDNGYQPLELNNKIFVNGAIVDSITGNFCTSISILDTNGNVVQKKKYDYKDYGNYIINKTINKNNSSVYGVGSVLNYKDSINDLDLLFTKFDHNGDTVFTRIFHDTGSVSVCDIINYTDHSFLVLCVYAKDYNDAEYSKTHLLVIDTLGNIIKSSYTPLSLYFPSTVLYDKTKGEIYTLGIHKSEPGPSFYLGSFLRCFTDSNLQSKFVQENITGSPSDYFNNAILHNGTIYATFCSGISEPPYPYPISILKYGKIRVYNKFAAFGGRKIGPTDPTSSIYASNMVADGNKIIFPVFNAYTGQTIFFCDTSLNLLCYSKAPSPDTIRSCETKYFTLTKSKRLISAGICWGSYVGAPGITNWNFMTTNYAKFLADGCGNLVGVEEQDGEMLYKLHVFPNPTTGDFRIVSNDLDVQMLDVSVINSSGQIVFEKKFLFSENTVNLSDQPKGIYLCNVITQDGHLHTLKIIKD